MHRRLMVHEARPIIVPRSLVMYGGKSKAFDPCGMWTLCLGASTVLEDAKECRYKDAGLLRHAGRLDSSQAVAGERVLV